MFLTSYVQNRHSLLIRHICGSMWVVYSTIRTAFIFIILWDSDSYRDGSQFVHVSYCVIVWWQGDGWVCGSPWRHHASLRQVTVPWERWTLRSWCSLPRLFSDVRDLLGKGSKMSCYCHLSSFRHSLSLLQCCSSAPQWFWRIVHVSVSGFW